MIHSFYTLNPHSRRPKSLAISALADFWRILDYDASIKSRNLLRMYSQANTDIEKVWLFRIDFKDVF